MNLHTAAVVVTYNRLDLLKECLNHLQAQTMACDILVVNNNSSDGTTAWLGSCESMNKNVHVHTLAENIGGAGGFNHGMRWAVEAGYDYVWIMDDDCLPEPTALERLMEASKKCHGNYGWLSSQCLWTDHSLCEMNLQRKNPFQDIRSFDADVIPAEMASFVSLFVPKETIRNFGLPIADFFIWTDDWEFTRRISMSVPCYVVRDSRVIHAMKKKTVVNISGDTPDRLPRYQYFYRNDVYLYRREGLRGWLWLIAKDGWHSLKVLTGNCSDKGQRLAIIWKGFWTGVNFFPPIEKV